MYGAAESRLKSWGKALLFPGLDLNTRCRARFLPRYFRPGPLETLDAGCGNGALAYAAYRLGNRVLGISNDMEQIARTRAYFAGHHVDKHRLSFEICDLYDLPSLGRRFDQIICSETLEHVRRDDLIVQYFYDMLRPGGVLHLCSPNGLHPSHHLGRTDAPEDGGHVRDGYTLESYATLLAPAGFQIVATVGLGSPILQIIDGPVRYLRNHLGDFVALPAFILVLPFAKLDYTDPKTPFSLYIQAIKT